MTRPHVAGVTLLALLTLPAIGTPLVTLAGGEVEEFDEFMVYIEINATDGDAGLQGLLDGGPWHKAKVADATGKTAWVFKPQHAMKNQGASEIFWESAEPQFSERPLEDFLARFPAGEYTVRGTSTEGERLTATDDLTHDIPAGAEVTSPRDAVGRGDDLIIAWESVTDDFQGGPLGSDIVSYEIVLEHEKEVGEEEVVRVMRVDASADTNSVRIPSDFFADEDGDYKFEIGAIEETGNRTFVEVELEFR